jgi:hypothetical protein
VSVDPQHSSGGWQDERQKIDGHTEARNHRLASAVPPNVPPYHAFDPDTEPGNGRCECRKANACQSFSNSLWNVGPPRSRAEQSVFTLFIQINRAFATVTSDFQPSIAPDRKPSFSIRPAVEQAPTSGLLVSEWFYAIVYVRSLMEALRSVIGLDRRGACSLVGEFATGENKEPRKGMSVCLASATAECE